MEIKHAPLIRTQQGLKLADAEIYLDPLQPVACAVISHAHGDHAIPGHDVVYCTRNTSKLLRARYRDFANQVICPDWMENFPVKDINFQFAPAGHMLGSAQIIWQQNGSTSLYTGDFKRQHDESCEAFELVTCDNLITETTFAQKDKTHPSAEEVILKLKQFNEINLVIGAYSMGKAQRLVSLFNKYLPEKKLMLHPKAAKYSRIYEEAGFSQGAWEPFNRRKFRQEKNIIYLVPPTVLESYIPSPMYLRGFATGWDEKHLNYDLEISVSDHADWNELLQTIDDTKATMIYTVHGDGEQLKSHLNHAVQVDKI